MSAGDSVADGIIEKFGKYELLEKIASGGMAEVFRARSRGAAGFEKIMVIKKILPNLANKKEFQELFIDEARIAVQLVNVNIVQVFDLGEIDGQYFMAMEYVNGLDLSRLLMKARNAGPFPIPLALFIIAEVLKALHFAHNRCDEKGKLLNIVHCDISPQNILISHSGEVKLTDFGISRAAFQMEEQHQVIRGKYAYMAPEQVAGEVLDGRTDLFALTIVLYEMLTGRRLFKAKTRNETLMRVRSAEVPSPKVFRPEISQDLENFLFKGLAKEREDRFPTAGRMLEGLSKVMVEENHRVTNNDLATYIRRVSDQNRRTDTLVGDLGAQNALPETIIALSAGAIVPSRSMGTPRLSLSELLNVWKKGVKKGGGEVWESNDESIVVVWKANASLEEAIQKCFLVSSYLQNKAKEADFKVSIGIAPGVAKISSETKRPAEGWELAGPFYLSRWLMNLSAHRNRVIVTGVVAKSLRKKTSFLGKILVQEDRTINLYEV